MSALTNPSSENKKNIVNPRALKPWVTSAGQEFIFKGLGPVLVPWCS
jgi:hypothetical protein